MASSNTSSTFYSVDTTTPSGACRAPINRHFIASDIAAEGLPFPSNFFDFTFQRFRGLSLKVYHWRAAIQELIRVTKPGGRIELFEVDLLHYYNEPTPETYDELDRRTRKFRAQNIEPSIARELGFLIASMPEIEETEAGKISLPVGWGGVIGEMMLKNVINTARKNVKGMVDNDEFEEVLKRWTENCRMDKIFDEYYWVIAKKKNI